MVDMQLCAWTSKLQMRRKDWKEDTMSLIQGQGTRATKIDASASLLRKVNKKLDRIIELLEEGNS